MKTTKRTVGLAINNDESTDSPAQPKTRAEQDQERIGVYLEKVNGPRPPTFRYKAEKGTIEPPDDNQFMLRVGLSETFATVSQDVQNVLYDQISNLFPKTSKLKAEEINSFLAILHKIQPKDELEAMLATQMIATHIAAMEFMHRMVIPGQTVEGVTANVDRATKMQRTFIAQLEALNKYKGKASQQKVVVEHVTVNSGGQAIVGSISQAKSNHSPG